jgi:ABC-type Na+ efflux pump permease subunit
MRYLNLLLALVMFAFAAVQYNDPDGLLWAVYYLVPAALAGLAAFRVGVLRTPNGMRLLWAGIAVWLGLMIFYWPPMAGFWRKEVWMEEETAREGMGVMIAWATVLVAWLTARAKPAR